MTLGHWILVGTFLALPTVLVVGWTGSASDRLRAASTDGSTLGKKDDKEVAVAQAANESYCTPELKKILRRVLQSCGLLGAGGGRGCQPLEAKNVATMSGSDFNALFRPMAERGGIVQFEKDSSEMDDMGRKLTEDIFSGQKGASYFFVVSRASPEGSVVHNRDLSQHRAEAVLSHLRSRFNDPDLDKEVGLLWLGEEFAQLEQEFCNWRRSRSDEPCKASTLNRSAFMAWIDCRL